MIKLYCLCSESGNSLLGDDVKKSGVALSAKSSSMERTNGVSQFINRNPSGTPLYKRHYPDVDYFECEHCGVKIVME